MADDARDLIERLFRDFWNAADPSAAEALFAPDLRIHNLAFPLAPGPLHGPAIMQQGWQAVRSGFPDMRFSYDDLIVQGSRAAFRWSAAGTHRGPFAGIPATGRPATYEGITICHLAEGKVAEAWVSDNSLALIQSLRDAAPA
jgi:hypothetical protein